GGWSVKGGSWCVRELECGDIVRDFKGHQGLIQCLAFSPDGRRLLSASGDQFNRQDSSMRLWDVATGKELLHFDEGHLGAAHCVAFAPDGRTVLSAGRDGTVRRWDVKPGAELTWRNRGRPGPDRGWSQPMRDIACSPDGGFAVSADETGTVYLWDLKKEQLVWKNELDDGLSRVLFSTDGRSVYSAAFTV